jgi:hypothetical protein
MTIGWSIFLIVVGAILRYAVTWRLAGVNLPVLGLILTIAGIVALVIRLVWMFNPPTPQLAPPPDLDQQPPPPGDAGLWWPPAHEPTPEPRASGLEPEPGRSYGWRRAAPTGPNARGSGGFPG